jgi:hypothetical protein
MDLNFPVFATGVRIFRASNDVAIEGPLFPGSTRILEKKYSIRGDPGPTNRGPTMAISLLALKIRVPVSNTGKLRSIGQMPVIKTSPYGIDRRFLPRQNCETIYCLVIMCQQGI